MKKQPQTRYYNAFTDDFVQSKNQDYKLPENYEWLQTKFISRLFSNLIYAMALLISNVYCRLFLHIKIKNKHKFKQVGKSGAFVYGNHTQPIGDVFDPAIISFPKRIHTIASPANLGIPFLGKILPYLGALPLADNLGGMKKLNHAIQYRIAQGRFIVIYPEAHVWDYCTFIRPFSDSSFKYPVKSDKPVFCMTTTYQKRKFGKKPTATIYIDGPYYRDSSLSQHEQATKLHDIVYAKMQERSKLSNYSYIVYEKSKAQ